MGLRRRGIEVELERKRCGLERETAEHALRDCGWCNVYWRTSLLRFSDDHLFPAASVADWFGLISNRLGKLEQCSFAMHLWSLWRARNLLCFENKDADQYYYQRMALGTLQDFQSAKLPRFMGIKPDAATTWSPPAAGWIKLNCDASIVGGLGTGLGAVLRNMKGEVMGSVSFFTKQEVAVDLAEAWGCWEGMTLAVDQDVQQLIIETDCSNLFHMLRRRNGDSSCFGDAVYSIVALFSSFQFISVSLVRRTANCVAHHLAQFTFNFPCGMRVTGGVSDSLEHFVIREAVAT